MPNIHICSMEEMQAICLLTESYKQAAIKLILIYFFPLLFLFPPPEEGLQAECWGLNDAERASAEAWSKKPLFPPDDVEL